MKFLQFSYYPVALLPSSDEIGIIILYVHNKNRYYVSEYLSGNLKEELKSPKFCSLLSFGSLTRFVPVSLSFF